MRWCGAEQLVAMVRLGLGLGFMVRVWLGLGFPIMWPGLGAGARSCGRDW